MSENDIQDKTQAGAAKWGELIDYAIGHRLIRAYRLAFKKTDAAGLKLQEAMKALLFDIRQKEAKRRRLAAQEDAARGLCKPPARL